MTTIKEFNKYGEELEDFLPLKTVFKQRGLEDY
jgi:hypothetical protein